MSLPLHYYHDDNLVHMQLVFARTGSDRVQGVAGKDQTRGYTIL
jgi:hypothetical protein